MNTNDIFNTKRNAVGVPPGSLEYTGVYKDVEIEINIIEYNSDEYKRFTIKNISELQINENYNYWINIIGLHDKDLINAIGKMFVLHHMDLEDVVQVFQRSKIEINKTYLFSVLKMIYVLKDDILREHISFFVRENVIITLQETKGDVFEELRNRLELGKGQVRNKDVRYLYYSMLDSLVDNFVLVTQKLENNLQRFEIRLVTEDDVDVDSLYSLKKELLYFERVVRTTSEAIYDFVNTTSDYYDSSLKPYYKDITEHLKQVSEYLRSFGEITDNLYDIQMAKVSNDMNKTMMTLTIFSTIFIPLSFLAGVFGMNFTHFPGMTYKYSLYIFIGVCVVIAVVMLRYVKRD